jgi:hypothetical protein
VTTGLIVYLVFVALMSLMALLAIAWCVRALVRHRATGPPAAWAVLLGAALLLAVPVAAASAYLFLPAPVSERTLTNSVERETNSAGLASDCSERGNRWRCDVTDSQGSGSAGYEITAGRSCWEARRIRHDAEIPMPRRPDGCTTLRDALGLFDLVAG